MDRSAVVKLLSALANSEMSVDEAYGHMQDLPFKDISADDLQFARLDTHRTIRQGMPEVIYCPGKTAPQVIAIAAALREKHNIIVGTKAETDLAAAVQKAMPEANYYAQGKILLWGEMPSQGQTACTQTKLSPKVEANSSQTTAVANGKETDFLVTVITAGTADLPIAEEAAIYLQAAGVGVNRINDIGVAGLHRLLAELPFLRQSSACIVVAGMDGALPGVVAGLIAVPVIAVPTSVGYGTSFAGITPLLTMLNSCAAGLTVVNIDNGFGAAVAALRIKHLIES